LVLLVLALAVLAALVGCGPTGSDALVGTWTGTIYGSQSVELVLYKDGTMTQTMTPTTSKITWKVTSVHDVPAITLVIGDGPQAGADLVTWSYKIEGGRLLLGSAGIDPVASNESVIVLTRSSN
jgi:hypothetical protein